MLLQSDVHGHFAATEVHDTEADRKLRDAARELCLVIFTAVHSSDDRERLVQQVQDSCLIAQALAGAKPLAAMAKPWLDRAVILPSVAPTD